MSIRFRCQQIAKYDPKQGYVRCGHQFEVEDAQAGDTIACPECGNDVEVPVGVGGPDAIHSLPSRDREVERSKATSSAEVAASSRPSQSAKTLEQQLPTQGVKPLTYASFDRQYACEHCGAQIRPEMNQCPGCGRLMSPYPASVPIASMDVQPAGLQRYLLKLLSAKSSTRTMRLTLDALIVIPAVLILLTAFATIGFFAMFLVLPLLGLVAAYFIATRHLQRMTEVPGLPLLPWQRYAWNLVMPPLRSMGWAIPEARNQPVVDLRKNDLRGVDLQNVDGVSAARVLDLTDAQITDTELITLHSQKQLRGISLIGTQVSAEGVFRLQQSLLNAWIWY